MYGRDHHKTIKKLSAPPKKGDMATFSNPLKMNMCKKEDRLCLASSNRGGDSRQNPVQCRQQSADFGNLLV